MNIKTITSTEGVNEVDFGSNASRFYWFQNLGTTTVHVSGNADIVAGADGVAELAAGGVTCIETTEGKVYVLGAGKVQIHNTGDKFCPFKIAPAAGGGGGNSYTKSESDAKYAQKTDIPSSLPANGGNADTVDGKHASDFVSSSTTQQVSNSRVELPNNVNVAEWLVQNAKIGTQYFRTDGAVGQTNLPGGLNTWMWFTYDGNRHFARAWTSAAGTTEFILNYVNGIGGWKEISCTPIKSTTFSGTTNEYGNVVFTAVGSKIPLFAECSPYCGIPLRFNDNYWIHCINPVTNNNLIVANTAVTGTVYYAEI